MSSCNLVLELYSEEIPARMQAQAEQLLRDIFSRKLKAASIDFNNLNIYTSPCRITILIEFPSDKIDERTIEYKGPRVHGTSDTAIDGFCHARSIARQDLIIKSFNEQEYYSYNKTIPSVAIKNLLPEIIASALREMVWPKSMRWGSYNTSWVRPLRNIMCLFGENEEIKINFGHLISNNQSFGHKFMCAATFTVSSWQQYKETLKEKYVILDRLERKEMILESLHTICKDLGVALNYNEKLLDEVTGLVEYPTVLYGTIPDKFMQLPEEIIITSVQTHQKYFTTRSLHSDKLAPYFLFVTNIISSDFGNVIKGNERVLLSRLSDALYFFHEDCRSTLYDKLPKLKQVVFHTKIGCMFDKTQRIKKICEQLSPGNNELLVAAELCKVDLITEAVHEFPDLQGIMGKYYALHDGISLKIAEMIGNHYLPTGADDAIPNGSAAILSLADKIDSLTSLYIAGERSTSGKDPFALRRCAFAIVRIILANSIRVKLIDIIDFACQQHVKALNHKQKLDLIKEILSFILYRFQYLLRDQFNPVIITAILKQYSDLDDLVELSYHIGFLDKFMKSSDGQQFLKSYKRAYNIARRIDDQFVDLGQIDRSKLYNKYEQNLYKHIIEVNEQIIKYDSKLAATTVVNTATNLQNKMNCLLRLTIPITEFLDNIIVNDENKQLAINRHMMLKYAIKISNNTVDFSLFIDIITAN